MSKKRKSDAWSLGAKSCLDCALCEGYINNEDLDNDEGYHLICTKEHFWLPWTVEAQPLDEMSREEMTILIQNVLKKAETCKDFVHEDS